MVYKGEILGFNAVVTEFCGARRATATQSH